MDFHSIVTWRVSISITDVFLQHNKDLNPIPTTTWRNNIINIITILTNVSQIIWVYVTKFVVRQWICLCLYLQKISISHHVFMSHTPNLRWHLILRGKLRSLRTPWPAMTLSQTQMECSWSSRWKINWDLVFDKSYAW